MISTLIPIDLQLRLDDLGEGHPLLDAPVDEQLRRKTLGELRLRQFGFGLGQAVLEDRRAGRVVLEAGREERASGLGRTEARRVHQGGAVDGVGYGPPDMAVGELGQASRS